MFDLIQQNPLTSFIVFLVPVFGAIWKVLDVLFVKPRDFRIAVLEKNVEEMRKEFQRSSRTATAVSVKTTSAAVEPSTDVVQSSKLITVSEVSGATLLSDLSAFYAAWKNPDLTELQREHFEKTYIGQKIIWRARLGSVSEEKGGLLWVGLNSLNDREYSVYAIAVFDFNDKEALLLLNKGEIVTVSATINSFFLSPMLKDCSVVRGA